MGGPRRRVASPSCCSWNPDRIEAKNEANAVDRFGLGQVDPKRPSRLAGGSRPSRRVRIVEGAIGRKAGIRAVCVGSSTHENVVRPLDRLNLAHERWRRIGPIDDEPQTTNDGVHEPGAARRLGKGITP
jgi:hypothetical protein